MKTLTKRGRYTIATIVSLIYGLMLFDAEFKPFPILPVAIVMLIICASYMWAEKVFSTKDGEEKITTREWIKKYPMSVITFNSMVLLFIMNIYQMVHYFNR